MSKYMPLWEYIVKNNCSELSFEQIKNILGFEIDHSFLTHKKELKKFNYEVAKISIKEKIIYFKKIMLTQLTNWLKWYTIQYVKVALFKVES